MIGTLSAIGMLTLMVGTASAQYTIKIDTPAYPQGLGYASVKSFGSFGVGGPVTSPPGIIAGGPDNIYVTMFDPRTPTVIVSSFIVNGLPPNGGRFAGQLSAPIVKAPYNYTVLAQIRTGTTVNASDQIIVQVSP